MSIVAAVIVTYDNEAMLESLLNDLAAQRRPPDETFVIDNSLNGRTEAMVKERFPYVLYTGFRANKGSAGGYYEGIRQASQACELIWLLDDDVRVPVDSLENLLKGLAGLTRGKAAAVVRSWCTERCPYSCAREMRSFAWRGTLIPAQIVKDVGLPQKDYFLYCDDTEYSLRITQAGYRMYWIPGSLVLEQRHADRTDLGLAGVRALVYRDRAKLYYAFRNQINLYLTRKMWLPVARTMLYAVKVAFLALFSSAGGKTENISAIMAGLKDGVRGVLGINHEYTPV